MMKIICLLMLLIVCKYQSLAAISVTIPAGKKELLAYSYAADTIANIFPTGRDGDQIFVWNPSTSSLSTINWDIFTEEWYPTNLAAMVINPGQSLFYRNGDIYNDYVVTITGTTVGTVNISMTGGVGYYVGPAHPLNLDSQAAGNPLCCIVDPNSPETTSFGYQFTSGDKAYTYVSDSDTWIEYTATVINGTAQWVPNSGSSMFPSMNDGCGLYLVPVQNTTWTQTGTPEVCNEE